MIVNAGDRAGSDGLRGRALGRHALTPSARRGCAVQMVVDRAGEGGTDARASARAPRRVGRAEPRQRPEPLEQRLLARGPDARDVVERRAQRALLPLLRGGSVTAKRCASSRMCCSTNSASEPRGITSGSGWSGK